MIDLIGRVFILIGYLLLAISESCRGDAACMAPVRPGLAARVDHRDHRASVPSSLRLTDG